MRAFITFTVLGFVSGRLQYPPSSDIIQGYGQAAPPSQLIGQFSSTNQGSTSGLRASSQFGLGRKRQANAGKIEFQNGGFQNGGFQDGGFEPQSNRYPPTGIRFTSPEDLVSGPPSENLYKAYLARAQDQSAEEKEFSNNIFGINSFRSSGNDKKIQSTYDLATPVVLSKPSSVLSDPSSVTGSGQFQPNQNWFGKKQTNLLQYPNQNNSKTRNNVELSSPSLQLNQQDGLVPTEAWWGKKNIFTTQQSLPNRSVESERPVTLNNPSLPAVVNQSNNQQFNPSNWISTRSAISPGDYDGLNNDDSGVITLENLILQGALEPQSFTVDVKSSYSARNAANY
ncbi:uncharacterized protein LOC111715903 [Eurytemora carolleeae]|uniref:uncharacterized protein LOC111715903 n=1 Tax=Eurytemora carolleeae TaxID=1294199 RepID=UPI000C7730A5|nr:uncharacterized protein LOC111715903 [Eurytemora carolleeae]|eukprot:XP_023347070.1 uncharacterized protein LOC111715903 [Eurytemora affinis]